MDNTHFDSKAIFKTVCATFSIGIRSFKAGEPRAFLESIGLSMDKTGAMFSSGQIAHRKSDDFLARLEHIGILRKSGHPGNLGRKAYSCFGNYALIWPLRDRRGDVVNLFSFRFAVKSRPDEFLNTEGLYPQYPVPETRSLIVCGDILTAATVLEAEAAENRQAVVSLFNNELLDQHIEILSEKALEEVIAIGCSDAVIEFLHGRFPRLALHVVNLPENETLNSLWVTHGRDKITGLVSGAQGAKNEAAETGGLVRVNEHKMLFRGDTADFFIMGNIGLEPSTLMLTLKIRYVTGQVSVHQIDLYSVKDRNAIAREAQQFGIHPNELEPDLMLLMNYAETEREQRLDTATSTKHRRIEPEISHARHMELLAFLENRNLMQAIDEMLETAGIIGEAGTRLTAFIIAASYKHHNPLHLILQGGSGSGKTHLINTVAACIPEDRILNLTRLSSMSLYYLDSEEITDRLLIVQDLDGLNDESLYSLRELQSAKSISNFRPYKDRKSGDIKTGAKEVRGSFASLMATTHGEIYFDNFSRSVVLGVSEDAEQTRRITEYQNKKRAGIIDPDTEHEARRLLRELHHLLKPHEVINPYAHLLALPVGGMMLRRLNDQFLGFTEMVTLLHQYQREKDGRGRLITAKEDLRHAAELFFTAIFLKTDDLDSGLRQFFEQMKRYVREQYPANKFRQRDIRHALRYSKSHTQQFLHALREREYIRIVGGSANKGFVYEIDFFDDAEKLKQDIKNSLLRQIDEIP